MFVLREEKLPPRLLSRFKYAQVSLPAAVTIRGLTPVFAVKLTQ